MSWARITFHVGMCGALNKSIVHRCLSDRALAANRFVEISLLLFISISTFLRTNLAIQTTKDYSSIRFTFQWNFSTFQFSSRRRRSPLITSSTSRYHGRRTGKRLSTSWAAWKWQKLLFRFNRVARSLCSLWLLVSCSLRWCSALHWIIVKWQAILNRHRRSLLQHALESRVVSVTIPILLYLDFECE